MRWRICEATGRKQHRAINRRIIPQALSNTLVAVAVVFVAAVSRRR
jgi:hypothetical protein